MPARKLNSNFLRTGLVCPDDKQHIEYTDADRTGLYIEVRSTSQGQGTWWYRFKDTDTRKTARIKIGRTTSTTVKEAKSRVRVLRAKRDLGEDIGSGQKRQQCISWNQLMDEHYFSYKEAHGKKSIRNDREMHNLRLKNRAGFGDQALNKITQLQIQQLHLELKASGLSFATADLYLKMIRHAMALACTWGLLKINPAEQVKQFNQTRRIVRSLDKGELQRLMHVLATDKNRMVANAIAWLLACGTRKGESLKAEWRHISREKGSWFIPSSNSKQARDRHVYLSDFALNILDDLGTEQRSPFLFVNPRTGGRLADFSKSWYRIKDAAQLENFRLNDLRHAHASMLGEAGVNAFLIKDALGHANVATSQIYVNAGDDARTKVANIAGQQLAAALKPTS
jgi:integrase